jgi:hypothetical protein
MITSNTCLKKYGDPNLKNNLVVINIPEEIRAGSRLPMRIYCNKDMEAPLIAAFKNLKERGFLDEFHTYNGCWNIRLKLGGTTWSLHSWGIAIDVNASENAFGAKPVLSEGFVKCFTDAGFDWGGIWKAPKTDGMHFQLKTI